MIELIKQDIDSLNDNTIAIRDNWRVKEQLANRELLMQFSPATKTALLEQMAPLMQWRNIQGEGEALRFDLDIVNAQHAQLLNRTKNLPKLIEDSRQPIQQKVRSLSMHLNQVRRKADTIATLQRNDFWQPDSNSENSQNNTIAALEQVRQDIRSVIHLRDKTVNPPPADITPIIDIKEDAAEYKTDVIKTNIRTVDYEIYRREEKIASRPFAPQTSNESFSFIDQHAPDGHPNPEKNTGRRSHHRAGAGRPQCHGPYQQQQHRFKPAKRILSGFCRRHRPVATSDYRPRP